ncbi:MAG: SusC/RagA family TonB-linked outer membrane protein [Longimicrobiales bacterium]
MSARPWVSRFLIPMAGSACCLLFLLTPDLATAQETGSIRGRVTDAVTGRAVSGAQVYVPGERFGSLTSSTGEYLLLNVPAGTYTVRVENLGYGSEEQQVTVAGGGTATADFAVTQAAINLDQIVVTGTAGEAQLRSQGNTVSEIDAATITEAAPIHDVTELLQARAPGLTILTNSGIAGTASKIRIRGASSLEAGDEPVVYVDGVRVTSGQLSDNAGTSNSTTQHTNALEAINPNDIASIEVIKGPAAATLYGAEAATGVIQIITKKGRTVDGGIEWTLSGEVGQDEWALDRVTTYWLCTPEDIAEPEDWPGCQGMDPNSAWQDRLVVDQPLDRELECIFVPDCQPNALRVADNWGTSISARGGGDRYNFYVSGEKSDEQGIYYNNYSRRTGGRANLGFVPTDKLNFNVNVGYTRQELAIPLSNNSSNGILRNAMRGRPAADAPWAIGYRGFSPEIANEFPNEAEIERTIIGLTTNYQPWDWFDNRLTLGMDKLERDHVQFFEIDQTGRRPYGSPEDIGFIEHWLPKTHRWTVDYAGTVNLDFAEDYTSAFSAGMQLNAQRFEAFEAEGEGLVANKLNLVSSAAITNGSQEYSEQTSLGFYVQEMVGWRNRLFGTVAMRVDDNSAFGSDFDVVYYPKASLAYVISDEPFFEVPYLEQLKLRAAWGRAGNAPAPFSADRTLQADVTTVGDVATNFLEFDEFGNPNLQAETGQEIELGFDAAAFGGRLGAEFTYYHQQTKDALVGVPDPPSTGFAGEHLINVGEVKNTGFEILLSGTPVYRRNVVWDAILSFAANDNELVSFGRDENGNPFLEEINFGAFATVQRHIEGFPLGGFWGLDVVRDANGVPILDADGDVTLEDEMEFVGPMLPTREVGFSSTVTLFGNLSLFGTLDYKGGNYQWCAICSIRHRVDLNTRRLNTPETPAEEVARLRSLQTIEWIYPADFVKLRELSATYSLDPSWVDRFGAKALSLTVGGRNLWMWTKYEGTSDPEQVFDGNASFSQTDYAGTPMTRRLAVSARVVF